MTTPLIKLAEISTFGGTDADEDALLIDAFEDHKAFLSLKEHKRFCVNRNRSAYRPNNAMYRAGNIFAMSHWQKSSSIRITLNHIPIQQPITSRALSVLYLIAMERGIQT